MNMKYATLKITVSDLLAPVTMFRATHIAVEPITNMANQAFR